MLKDTRAISLIIYNFTIIPKNTTSNINNMLSIKIKGKSFFSIQYSSFIIHSSAFIILLFLSLSAFSLESGRASLVLDMKKARVNYDMAKTKYENDERLFNENAISKVEFSQSKNSFLSAEVDYQKLILRLLIQQSYIIVEKAVKYQDTGGNKRVKVRIRSTMEGDGDYLNQFKEHLDVFTPEMRTGKTYNIFLSLNNLEDKTIIGSPYEIRIPSIELGKSVDVDFGLLKDVESLQVLLNYDNKKDEKNIFLEKDAGSNFISITSSQFSQETDLGSNATYDLNLERFSTIDDTYKLMVLNLPRQVSTNFLDAETNARLSQLRFNQGENVRKLSLKAYLPQLGDDKIKIDSSLTFYALAVSEKDYGNFIDNENKNFTDKDFENMKGGVVKLRLIPNGVGKLEVRAPNLYHEITKGDSVIMSITVKNYGTRRVDNIKTETDNPLYWSSLIEPVLIQSLEPGEETKVNISIITNSDVSVGAQEIKIKTEAYANNRRVETSDKTVRIQVNAKTSIWGTLVLIVLLIGLIVGIVIFGVKISKR